MGEEAGEGAEQALAPPAQVPTSVYFLLHLRGDLDLELRVAVADPPPPRGLDRELLLQLQHQRTPGRDS